jgi:hypothetical protein
MGLQRTSVLAAIGLFAAVGVSTPSNAAMLAFQTFNANGLSTDDFGPTGGGILTAHVPVGSTIVAAFLYKKGASDGSYDRAPVSIPPGSGPDITVPSDDPDNEALVVVFNDPNKPAGSKDVLAGGGDLCASDLSLTCKDVPDGTVATDGLPPNGNNGNANDDPNQDLSTETLLVYNDERPSEQIPEPATLTLFGAGLLGLGAIRRRLKKA